MTGSLMSIPVPAYELRLGDETWRHGLPGYRRGFLVWDHGDGLAEIRLVVGRIRPSEMRAVRRLLLEHGFTRILIERRDANGTPRTRTVDLRGRQANKDG